MPIYRNLQRHLVAKLTASIGKTKRILWRLSVTVLVLAPLDMPAMSETLEQYAQACDAAIGVTVPDFNCDLGTAVPVTNLTSSGSCDRPDQLNQDCDPGSRFQVLAQTPTAYAVGHCRKRGNAIGNSLYSDIAVIQHNKVNGATCFYQALDRSLDGHVKAPAKGRVAWPSWKTPAETAGIGCAKCHDNGPIIRSPYLTQITGTNQLPGAGEVTFNRDQPYTFVGLDFAGWKTFKVEIPGNYCISCHRLAVSNLGFGNGTAQDFAIRATTEPQSHKNPLSSSAPLWMLAGQTSVNAFHQLSARSIKDCADKFKAGLALPAGCKITQLGGSGAPPNDRPVACSVFDDGYTNLTAPSQAIYFAKPEQACIPDGSAQGTCRRWFGRCSSLSDGVAVKLRVFNDGDSSQSNLSDAIYAASPAQECIPDGTATGTCRKWFGLGETADGRRVSCYLFDDGLTNWVGPTHAIVYNGSGQVCMPDGTSTGTCRKWFGNCQVGAALPKSSRTMNVEVSPYPIPTNRSVTFSVATTDTVSGQPVRAVITIDGRSVGMSNSAITFRFVPKGRPPNVVYPVARAVAGGYSSVVIDLGFPDPHEDRR
jgi:hypothetical protein